MLGSESESSREQHALTNGRNVADDSHTVGRLEVARLDFWQLYKATWSFHTEWKAGDFWTMALFGPNHTVASKG